jgi:hypothetical protein
MGIYLRVTLRGRYEEQCDDSSLRTFDRSAGWLEEVTLIP